MFVTIITDCRDENAAGRQLTRVGALFGVPAALVGVGGRIENAHGESDLAAAGNLIDILDASEGKEGIALVNVAPRHHDGKQWPNGTPFCYFYYQKTLVLASVAGRTLSLVKKLGLAGDIAVFDVGAVASVLVQYGIVSAEEGARIADSQFRSFDVLPRAALALVRGIELPGETLSLGEIADAPRAVWFIDNFGNCKTTLLSEELNANMLSVQGKMIGLVPSLKDVPNGEAAAIVGSSGVGNRRFVEIVVQGSSAAEKFGLKVGNTI
jgi:hypothetical protein